MGFFDDVKDTVDDAVDEAKDTASDAVDEAKDVVEDNTGVDVDDAVDEAKDTASDAVDEAKDTASDFADRAKEEASDAVDAVEDNTGVDVDRDGDVGGSSSGDSSSSGGGSSGGSSSSSSSGSSSGGSSSSSSSGGSSSFSGSSFSGGSSSGGSSSGSSSGGGSSTVTERIFRPDQKTVPDNVEDIEKSQELRENNPVVKYATPDRTEALENKKQNLESLESTEESLSRIKSSDADKVQFGSGETVSKSEAVEKLSQQKKNIKENIEENEDQFLKNVTDPVDTTVTDEMRKQARANDVDLNQEFNTQRDNPNYQGTRTDFRQNQPGEDLATTSPGTASVDLIFSDSGAEYLRSNLPGSDTSSEEVRRREVAERQVDGDPTFSERASSPGGLFVTGAGAGAGFSALVKGASRLPALSGTTSKALQGAGYTFGAYETGKATGRIAGELEQGDEGEAVDETINFISSGAGVLAGSKAVNLRYGTKTGSTNIRQKAKVDQDSKGIVQFEGETNLVKPSLVPGRKPSTDTQTIQGKGVVNDQQVKGTFEIDTPGGSSRSGRFESQSVPQGSGTTRQGREFQDTSEIIRTTDEGKLFRNIEDSESYVRSILKGRSDADAEEVLDSFDNVVVKNDDDIQALEFTSLNREGDQFGEATTYVIGRSSSRGGSGSGSGSRNTGTGSGGQTTKISQESQGSGSNFADIRENTNINQARFRDLAEDQAEKTARQDTEGSTIVDQNDATSESQAVENQQTSGSFQGSTTEVSSLSESQLEQKTEEKVRDSEGVGTTQKRDIELAGGRENLGTTSLVNSEDQQQRNKGRTTSKLVDGLENDAEKIVSNLKIGQGNSNRNKNPLIQRFKLGQDQDQLNPLKTGFKQVTPNDTDLKTGFGDSPGTALTPKLVTGLAGLGRSEQTQSSITSNRDVGSGVQVDRTSGLNLDFFSSQFVEQRGETPTFNLSSGESQFGGVIAEEEDRENLEQNYNIKIF